MSNHTYILVQVTTYNSTILLYHLSITDVIPESGVGDRLDDPERISTGNSEAYQKDNQRVNDTLEISPVISPLADTCH